MNSPKSFLSLVAAVAMTFGLSTSTVQAQCLADVNHDHLVDGVDLTQILSTWGTNGGSVGSDINGDGSVDGGDLAIVLGAWGVCPDPTWGTVLEWTPDPAVVTDANLRAAITATNLPWRVRDNGTNIEMLLVPGGTFTMGCSASNLYACASDEYPTHQLALSAFYVGRYEVTQAQWQAKMGSNPSYFQPPKFTWDTNRPVEQVSWNMIQSFNTTTGLRLPTEAEWEYAFRAGTTAAFHSFPGYTSGTDDDTLLGNIAWYASNSGGQPQAVGGKYANALGLHDVAGNVWEWCEDWYGGTYYASSPTTNPTGPLTGSAHVLRGGDWASISGRCRVSWRGCDMPDYIAYGNGFRVVRNP